MERGCRRPGCTRAEHVAACAPHAAGRVHAGQSGALALGQAGLGGGRALLLCVLRCWLGHGWDAVGRSLCGPPRVCTRPLPNSCSSRPQYQYPPRNFPLPPEGCTNEAVKELVRWAGPDGCCNTGGSCRGVQCGALADQANPPVAAAQQPRRRVNEAAEHLPRWAEFEAKLPAPAAPTSRRRLLGERPPPAAWGGSSGSGAERQAREDGAP